MILSVKRVPSRWSARQQAGGRKSAALFGAQGSLNIHIYRHHPLNVGPY